MSLNYGNQIFPGYGVSNRTPPPPPVGAEPNIPTLGSQHLFIEIFWTDLFDIFFKFHDKQPHKHTEIPIKGSMGMGQIKLLLVISATKKTKFQFMQTETSSTSSTYNFPTHFTWVSKQTFRRFDTMLLNNILKTKIQSVAQSYPETTFCPFSCINYIILDLFIYLFRDRYYAKLCILVPKPATCETTCDQPPLNIR